MESAAAKALPFKLVLEVRGSGHVLGNPVFVDWSVTCEYSTNAPRRHSRSLNDGFAAAQQVGVKRRRYPPSGGELAPPGPVLGRGEGDPPLQRPRHGAQEGGVRTRHVGERRDRGHALRWSARPAERMVLYRREQSVHTAGAEISDLWENKTYPQFFSLV